MSALPNLPLRIKRKKGATFSGLAASKQLSLEAVQGNLFGLMVLIESTESVLQLRSGGFGKFAFVDRPEGPSDGSACLSLFLEEAWFLISHLKCLRVCNCTGQEIAPGEFLKLSKLLKPNFATLYAVYFHFRRKNWIVAQGTNYGVDYVLYPDLPSVVHSSYLVVIRPSSTERNRCPLVFRNLACYSRLATTVSKELLVCSVDFAEGESALPDVQFYQPMLESVSRLLTTRTAKANNKSMTCFRWMHCAKCKCLRWTFRLPGWNPTLSEWKRSLESIQPTEVERVGPMRCRQDALATVVGRLMLRKAVCLGTGLSWCEFNLHREPNGKPCLSDNETAQYAFNISHHGDFVVLAAGIYGLCGVDVMRLQVPKVRKTMGEYLELMKSNFSPSEWATFWAPDLDDGGRLRLFYRYWASGCLKESYLKATGKGIHSKLWQLDFRLGKPIENVSIQTSTRLRVEGRTLDGICFEESSISSDHVACVCYSDAYLSSNCRKYHQTELSFCEVDWNYLIEDAQPLHKLSESECPSLKHKQIRKY